MALTVVLATGAVLVVKLYQWASTHPSSVRPALSTLRKQVTTIGSLVSLALFVVELLERGAAAMFGMPTTVVAPVPAPAWS